MTIIALTLFIAGVLLFIFSDSRNRLYVRQRYYVYSRKRARWRTALARQNTEQRLRELGLPISLYHIQIARYVLLFFVGFIWFGISSTIRFEEVQYLPILAVVLLFLMTAPREVVWGYKMPLAYFLEALEKIQQERYGNELYLLMIQMKNSFQIYGDKAPSSVAILEELTGYTDKLKPIMRRFLSYWYSNDKELAIQYFSNKVGTNDANKLAQLLVRLDDLTPSELLIQLTSHIEIFRENRETARVSRDQTMSNILFVGAFLSLLCILFNFITVSVLVDFMYNQDSMTL